MALEAFAIAEESFQDNSSNNSPFHESNSSILSPSNTESSGVENDADSDSSTIGNAETDFCNSHSSTSTANSSNSKRKLKKRTSSNVFTFKSLTKDEDVFVNSLTEVDLAEGGEDVYFSNVYATELSSSKLDPVDNQGRNTTLEIGEPVGVKVFQKAESISTTSSEENGVEPVKQRKNTAVDGLLFDIYDRFQRRDSSQGGLDSDMTECSTTSMTSVYVASSFENDDRPKLDKNYLERKDVSELEKMVWELKRGINMLNSKLVKLLKQRDRNAHKIQENFNVLTALLQATSQKRRIDTRIRFSFIPRPGKRGFRQWIDALKAVARIQAGIPGSWRKRTWLSLAEFFLKDVDWEKLKKICFNDRKNPDDDELDTQIVKDLHRTGCGWFFEHDTEEDRASLKRVLLAYARWNKSIGYCQGFNVIAALILQVMGGNEEETLKVMIFLVDYVLPRNYFANNLRALSVDMAVLRDLMGQKLPKLSQLLQQLQKSAMDTKTNKSASYEPPLINMFTMQWFLTLFATCLPRDTVLRIWDSVLLEGSEILLRVALAIWGKLGTYFDGVFSAADFYMAMGNLIQDMMTDTFIDVDKLIKAVYEMSPFPWFTVNELREKYTYDIHPFATFNANRKSDRRIIQRTPVSEDEDDSDDEKMIGCLGFVNAHSSNDHTHSNKNQTNKTNNDKNKVTSKTDITKVTPGAYLSDRDQQNAYEAQIKRKEMIRTSEKLDLNKLKDQYGRMRRLQQKAMLVFNASDFRDDTYRSTNPPSAINHLFVDVNNVATPRTKYKRASNFPALKAPSKGSGTVLKPVKDNVRKVIYEGNDGAVDIYSTKEKTYGGVFDNNSALENYAQDASQTESINTELEKVKIEDTYFVKDKSATTSRVKSFPSKTRTPDAAMRSTSLLYQVDKSALYPANFNPFPQRIPKRKTMSAK